eukprot:745837-Hanusia_phi.AAC.4
MLRKKIQQAAIRLQLMQERLKGRTGGGRRGKEGTAGRRQRGTRGENVPGGGGGSQGKEGAEGGGAKRVGGRGASGAGSIRRRRTTGEQENSLWSDIQNDLDKNAETFEDMLQADEMTYEEKTGRRGRRGRNKE